MTISALDLLSKLSSAFQVQNEVFSKEEIKKKINEIKYLSTQKKIPKITLRKEIIHLENQFKKIEFLEEALERQKRLEKSRIAALKRQNEALKKKLALSGDQDLTKKVNKLTHLIGDSLAKSEVKNDVELSEKIAEEMKQTWNSMNDQSSETIGSSSPLQIALSDEGKIEDLRRMDMLKRRIEMLKQELEITQFRDPNGEKTKIIEAQIRDLESAILKFAERHPELIITEVGTAEFTSPESDLPDFLASDLPLKDSSVGEEDDKEKLPKEFTGSTSSIPGIKHDLIFNPLPPPSEADEKKDLPLPPPPKRIV
ncbi:hypothetical protein HYT52_00730 [Candidatus Woesearchaeota archaeon]|nr:hypothetical protein [Candidatus Woesearchaeota archaeon]